MKGNIKIAVSVDHGGYELKEILVKHLKSLNYDVLDLGVHSCSSVDYPDQAKKLVEAIYEGLVDRGILVCGTGIGISISANRYKGIRAALCHDDYTARMSRKHNNANVLVLGGRTTGVESAKSILDAWLTTEFESDNDRHLRRVEKIESNLIADK